MKKINVGQIGIAHNHGEGKMKAIRKFSELFNVIGYSEKDEELIRESLNGNCNITSDPFILVAKKQER